MRVGRGGGGSTISRERGIGVEVWSLLDPKGFRIFGVLI